MLQTSSTSRLWAGSFQSLILLSHRSAGVELCASNFAGAHLPTTVREDNFHDASKKNPGERGYGSAGGATAQAGSRRASAPKRNMQVPVLRKQVLGQRLHVPRYTGMAGISRSASARSSTARTVWMI